jgi:hypothetical protein
MEGARWNRGARMWEFKNSFRNHFALKILMDPVSTLRPWDVLPELPDTDWGDITPYGHQVDMLRHIQRKRAIIVGQVGVGKTFPVMKYMERTRRLHPTGRIFYVAPRSGMISIRRELDKFNCTADPELMTYEGLKKMLKHWVDGEEPPILLILDESSRVKSPKAQRSTAALYCSNQMALFWKGEESVILMTGTPSPRDPCDWWMQCEIARPGFLREGDIHKFRRRLGIYEKAEGDHGSYPKLVQWKDGSECITCRRYKDALAEVEELANMVAEMPGQDQIIGAEKQAKWVQTSIADYHTRLKGCPYCHGTGYLPDEVGLLGRRMSGLVEVWNKDVLDLPRQVFVKLRCEPPQSLINAAQIIAQTSGSVIECLNKLRQLSDGFLYDDDKVAQYGPSGKDALLNGLLDQYRDVGRGVVYAAYHASVDRVTNLCKKAGWNVWKMDGRGVETWDGRGSDSAYAHFQDGEGGEGDPVVFVAHPKSGGMALTLTRSPWLNFFSNDFDGESREQGEGRIHRPGMDINKGATVYDFVNLPVDELVIDKLTSKRRLQTTTMSEILACLYK